MLIKAQGCDKPKVFRKVRGAPRSPFPVQELIRLMNEHKLTADVLCIRAGVHKGCISDWRKRQSPKVDTLEACLNVLGYTLTVSPKKDPP